MEVIQHYARNILFFFLLFIQYLKYTLTQNKNKNKKKQNYTGLETYK